MARSHVYDAALAWLERGVSLIPLQPGSKRVVAGFGPYLKRISDADGAKFWFHERNCNMAVLTGGGLVVLDFDDLPSYERWCSQNPGPSQSLTERTLHGRHVFFTGDSETGRHPDGFEVKGLHGFVTVAPSSVGGVSYALVNEFSSIQHIPPGLSLLSVRPRQRHTGIAYTTGNTDTIGRIKSAWDLLEFAQSLTRLTGHGRWRHGKCPLHDDRNPSFWVDTEMGIWGCYACDLRGDVINLYQYANNITTREAIKAMAEICG